MCQACRSRQRIRKADDTNPNEPLTDDTVDTSGWERELAAALLAWFLLLRRTRWYALVIVPRQPADMPLPDMASAHTAFEMGGNAVSDLFDSASPDAKKRFEQYRDQFIREYGEETRQAVQMVYDWAQRRGLSPEDAEAVVRAATGMNKRQAKSYLSQLSNMLDSGKSQKAIDKWMDSASKRFLKDRAKTTAENETWRAWQLGKWTAAEEEAVKTGAVVKKFWHVVYDERLCKTCAPIPAMNSGGVDYRLPFLTPSGPIMFPPLHTNCRCHVTYSIQPTGGF